MKEIRYWTSHTYKNPERWLYNLGLDASRFHLVYDKVNPDYLILTERVINERLMRNEFKRLYSPKRLVVFWADECISPDFNLCDYAMSYDKGLSYGDRTIRRPVMSIFANFEHPPMNMELTDADAVLATKIGFCNFIYSNPNAHPMRDALFHTLSKYKTVDSLGPHLHNCTVPPSRGGHDFVERSIIMKTTYKFSIASENATFKGYTSEKIITSFLARSIPIYWGNPDVESEFNPKAFINANKLTLDELVDMVKEIDTDDAKWKAIASEPPMTVEQHERWLKEEAEYKAFMENVFAQPLEQALRRPEGYWQDNYRRTYFAASAKQLPGVFRLMKFFGRETLIGNWVAGKLHPVE